MFKKLDQQPRGDDDTGLVQSEQHELIRDVPRPRHTDGQRFYHKVDLELFFLQDSISQSGSGLQSSDDLREQIREREERIEVR